MAKPKTTSATAIVGESFPLAGSCLIGYPDGGVVTAAREHTFKAPGDYRVIYDGSTVNVTVTAPEPSAPEGSAPADG